MLRWPYQKLSSIIWPKTSGLGNLLPLMSYLDLFSTARKATIGLLNISVFQKKIFTTSRWQCTVCQCQKIADLSQNILKHNDKALIHHALHTRCVIKVLGLRSQ